MAALCAAMVVAPVRSPGFNLRRVFVAVVVTGRWLPATDYWILGAMALRCCRTMVVAAVDTNMTNSGSEPTLGRLPP